MIALLRRAWTWFLEGLLDALLAGLDRARGVRTYRVEIAGEGTTVHGPDGSPMGRLSGGEPCRFDPPELAERLAGAAIDLVIPASWFFRRDLDPVAAQSVPFLDAFVRHQIDRITPWRVADAHYCIATKPLPGDPTRVAVALGVVPKRLTKTWIGALEALRPRRLQIVPAHQAGAERTAILIGDDRSRHRAALRRPLVIGLLATGLGFAGLIGWLQWEAGLVHADNEEQAQILEDRKAVLMKARLLDRRGDDAAARLRQLRSAVPLTVEVIDALATALPDSAHLTDLILEKDRLAVTGVSTGLTALVPSLERSGWFSEVAFGAETTRVETGEGDRFHLQMRVVRLPPTPAKP